ncbi:hypothetical protein FRAHR75_770027 [Frankia sp. Hr75.2]|nr:hypothetical protein FRAHR75_770027 [Frankia sp. Hr75.2]
MTITSPVRCAGEALDDARWLLDEAGWTVLRGAVRAAGADLVAYRETFAVVQVRPGGPTRVRPTDWNRTFDVATRGGGIPLLACRLEAGGPVGLFRMTARKSGSRGQRSPFVPFDPGEILPFHGSLPAALRAVA